MIFNTLILIQILPDTKVMSEEASLTSAIALIVCGIVTLLALMLLMYQNINLQKQIDAQETKCSDQALNIHFDEVSEEVIKSDDEIEFIILDKLGYTVDGKVMSNVEDLIHLEHRRIRYGFLMGYKARRREERI